MALRTFQFCIVFTIGGILINSTVLSNTTTESPASTPSLESPPLSVRLERPSQYVRVVPRGQSVYFDCPATPGPGTSPSSVEYQWYLNDKLITSNTPHYKQYGNGTLFISKISGKKSFQNLTFEGDYRCHFTNNVGTVITEAITLKLPMLSRSFIEQPNNMTVEVGDYAIFNCRITSVPEAIISWEHNSRPLTSERFSSKYFQLPSGSLVISQVQRIEDEGSYSCTATNRIQKKSRKSVSGYLTVIPVQNKPKKPHLVPHNLTTHLIVNVREDVHFYCFANGYQKPFIRWEVPFNSTVNKTVALNSSFISIRNITADIPRNYTCIAQNSLGIESQTWTISLRPYFTEKPISKRVPPARTVRLNCTASGWPEPKITWLKDGEPLGEALKNGQIISKYGRITIKPDNMLVIADTITNDSGLYQCVASNSVGEIRSVARVLVASIFNTRLPPPSPPSGVTCRSYTSNSVCLQWSPQPLNATKIEAYTVHYRSKDGTDKEQQHATNETYSLVELSLPNTQYLFYLRAYIRHAASEQSEPIVCQGGELTKRNITLEAESPEVLNIQWTPLFNDTPCGEIPQYKVQWRRYKHASNSAKLVKFGDIFTNSNIYKYQITDLVPSHTYEVRVLTMFQDETVPWLTFTMPNLTTFINQTKSSSSISHLEAIPTSPNSINLTWQTSLNENFNDFGYYNICYTEAISLETCEENGTYIKSRTNSIEIKNLKPYTLYKFQVRSHDLNDNYGNFSNLVECFTKEGIPSPVRGLTSKYVNATTKTIEWQEPSQINGVLRNYSLYYYIRQCSTMESTINIKHCDNTMLPSLNKWNTIVIAPNKYRAELMNLKPGAQYNVTIFAETGAGRSKPVSIVTQIIPTIYQIGTQDSHGERKPNTDTDQSQTIGIIIGCSIAGLCITLCITYMMWYRRCLKSTLNARHHNNGLRTFNAPTNGHHHQSQHHIVHNNLDSSSISIVRRSTTPAITTTTGLTDNESSESTSIPMAVNVSSERGELHEMQSLVHSTDASSLPPHIPPVVQTHLDTKGGASFPNGHINGFKFPINNGRLANGIVRITENPQYNIDTEYDTRSAGSNNNSRETNCNFEEDHHLLQSPHGRHLDEDDENDTFNQHHNSTQLTNLDNSLLTNSISSTPRRISPILGPNG